jgi:hypothetical protein
MLSVTIKAAMTVVPTKISSKVDVGSFLYLRRLLLSFQFSIDIYAYMIFLDQIAFLRRPAPVSFHHIGTVLHPEHSLTHSHSSSSIPSNGFARLPSCLVPRTRVSHRKQAYSFALLTRQETHTALAAVVVYLLSSPRMA